MASRPPRAPGPGATAPADIGAPPAAESPDGPDLHSGTPWWLLTGGLGLVVPPLRADLRCQVAVIGSGITGALVADSLARAGVRVAVLDRAHLTTGSTLASTALLMYDTDVPLHRLSRLVGRERAERVFRLGVEAIAELERAAADLDCPFHRRPSIYFCACPESVPALRRECAARAEAGLPVRWLSPDELGGSMDLAGAGAIRSEIAAETDPYRLSHALLRRAMRAGARVHDRTAVSRLVERARGVTLHTERGATVVADYVVDARGYEAASELAAGMVDLRSTYALVSEPTAPRAGAWADRALLWEFADPYLYARWTGDRVLLGGEDVPFADAPARDALIGRKTRDLAAKFARRMPSLAIEPAFAWTGTFATTPDGLGYIGPQPGRPRVLFALGFGGNGITFAALAARFITSLVTGRPDEDSRIFAFDRARRADAGGW
ncbi:MAG TPA: FAD-dependent oxidoreductase [Phycisphaerales bacterium]|nr:FAD-dependent oxidoreductase [Phycisphaerales bacterium]